MREVVHARSIKFPRVRNNRLPSGRVLCEKEIFFLSIVPQVTRKVNKTNLREFCRSHLLSRATRSIFSSLLYLILIHLADAYILVMACVDCARACSEKPFRASLRTVIFRHRTQFFRGYYSRVAWMFSWRFSLCFVSFRFEAK